MRKLFLILSFISLVASSKSQEPQKQLIGDFKNSAYASVGLKSLGYSLNYERIWKKEQSKFYAASGVGIGYFYTFNAPLYLHLGYGDRVSWEVFGGTTLKIDPNPSSKEARDDYLNNPNSFYGRLVEPPDYPIEPYLSFGTGIRFLVWKRWFIRSEVAVLFERIPSYEDFPKWKYKYELVFPEISGGIRF